MKIDKLTINNLYGIKGTKEIDMSAPVLALWGENGAGKTSVVESVRFAITGAGKVNVLHAGETDGFVEMSFGDHSIRRLVSFNQGKYKLQTFIDGRKVAGKAAEQFLSEQFQTKVSDIKLLTSKNLTTSLEDGAGDLLMSYMDNSTPRETVIKMVLSHNPDNKYLTEEAVREYGTNILPEEITYGVLAAILKNERDVRRLTKKEGDNLNAKLRSMDASGAAYDEKELQLELEKLQSQQALEKANRETARQYELIKEKRKKTLLTIEDLKAKKSQLEELIKKLTDNRPDFPTERTGEVKESLAEEIKKLQSEQQTSEKELAVADSDLAWIQSITDKLKTGGCPFSSDKLQITCSTDMSPVFDQLQAKRESAENAKQKLTQKIEKIKDTLEKKNVYMLELTEYQEKSVAVKDLNRRIEELESALPKEPEKVKTSSEDFTKQIRDVQNKLFLANKYKEILAIKKEIIELAKKWYLSDAFIRILSDDGPVVSLMVEEYRTLLTDAANNISDITGIYVRFTTDKGIDMQFCTKGTEYRPYTSLSAGEQVLAYITVTDMLSRLSGYTLLVIDDMDKLDNKNLECVVKLLTENTTDYENIIIAGVNHDGTEKILDDYHICRGL